MKKLFVAFALFALSLLIPAQIQAQEGVFKPTSRFYFLQNVIEDTRLLFTFAKDAKLDYLLELTERRVEELENQPEIAGPLALKITTRYENHFRQMEKITEQVQNRERITQRIRESNLRQQEVLARVYGQVPEAAQKGIANAQENSSKNVARIVERVEGSETAAEYLEQVQLIQQEEVQKQIELAPMESGGPAKDASQTEPKTLQPGQPAQEGKELKPLGEPKETTGEPGGPSLEPAAPAQMQSPAGRN